MIHMTISLIYGFAIRSIISELTLFRKNMLRKRQDIKTYIFFCFEKERKKLPETFSLARDIQHTKQLRKAKVIDIHLFCFFFLWAFEQCTKTRNTRKILKENMKKKILRKYWKRKQQKQISQHAHRFSCVVLEVD